MSITFLKKKETAFHALKHGLVPFVICFFCFFPCPFPGLFLFPFPGRGVFLGNPFQNACRSSLWDRRTPDILRFPFPSGFQPCFPTRIRNSRRREGICFWCSRPPG